MSSEAETAAIAILTAPDPSPAPAEQGTPGADPGTEAAPVPAPEPVATPAPADDVADLYAQLEARKAKRAAEAGGQSPDVIAKLQSELAELRARLAQPPAHTPQDFPALVRQYGEVEAMRMVGIDPLEFFGRFKQVAKDPDAIRRQQAEMEHQARLREIAEKTDKLGQTLEQREAAAQAEATRQQWNAYVKMVEAPETATPLLAKLPVSERVERTQRLIAKIHADYGPDVAAEITDVQLAKLVEKDLRSLRDLFVGTDAGATTKQVPATDGAKQPTTASLTNDLASQSSGGTRQLSEKERLAAAIAIAQQGG